MLRKILVAGHNLSGPVMMVMQVELDEDSKLEQQKKLIEKASKQNGVSGPYVIFDAEKDCTSIPFLDLKPDRVWANAPIFLESMA